MKAYKQTLLDFLKYPLWSTEEIFEKFAEIKGFIFKENPLNKKERFLYIPGKRKDRIVLVAHADTVWDAAYEKETAVHKLIVKKDKIFSNNAKEHGLGADDRAGCAILWILRNSGHSILLTDGEEKGKLSSKWLMENYPKIAAELNTHQFMMQFDRQQGRQFKCYNIGTDKFRKYVSDKTGYDEPDRLRSTDITELCRVICGVNLSVGYYNEHTKDEYLNIDEWLHTVKTVKKWLKEKLPLFQLLNT